LILRYHLIDTGAYKAQDLLNNSTIASSLGDPRIRVEPKLFPYPHLTFNFFSNSTYPWNFTCVFAKQWFFIARGPTIKAKNGIIHLVSFPLLPPLTPLEELFIFPFIFSELTSGLQKVGLDDVISPWVHTEVNDDQVSEPVMSVLEELVKEHKDIENFTVFAPSNRVSVLSS